MSGAKKGILRALNLVRRGKPAPVQPAVVQAPPVRPLPGSDAQGPMLRAAETSRTLRGRGIDLNGRRDAMRQDIDALAEGGDVQGATTRAAAFETLAGQAMAWQDRAGELATARTGVAGLEAAGDPTADTLADGLDRAEGEAAADRYPAAGTQLDRAAGPIAARVLAWPLIARAEAARAKAERAGQDLGGQRDTLRQEVEDLASRGDYAGAGTKAGALETQVDTAIWASRAGALAAAKTAAQTLKTDKDPTADALIAALGEVDKAVAGNRLVEAVTLLDGAEPEVTARAQAWPLIVRADAAAKKAETAGLDLGGKRAALRQEIEDLADRADYAGAGTKAGTFETLVDDAIAWQGRAGDVAKARKQATFLKSGGDPKADALLAGLKAAEDEAAAGRYTQATLLVGPAITAVTDRAPEWKLLRQHAVEMAKMKPGLDLAASDIPGHGDASHTLATAWQALDGARANCPDVPGAIPAADLADRRKGLADALAALNSAYGSMPKGDATEQAARNGWGGKQRDVLEAKYSPLWQKVKYVRVRTAQQQTLLDQYNAMRTGGGNWTRRHDRIDAKAAKAEQLLAAVANPVAIADERAWFSRFGKVRDRVEAASKLTDDTEPTKTRIATFKPLWTEVDTLVKGAAADRYTQALAKLAALVTAADDVLRSRLDAAAALVDGIGAATPGATDTDPTIPATPAERAQRAVTASQVMPEEIRTMVLRRLPVEKKLALLDGLRADGGPPAFTTTGTPGTPGYSTNADDPARRAQRDIYMAMDLDPAFVADEKVQREEVLKELMKDKEELQRARDEWPALDEAARLKVMEKIVAAHCKAMGFDEPKNPGAGPNQGKAIVVLDVGRPTNNGSYDPRTDSIQVNRGGKVFGDFELMMDLIFHENSHNKQIKLANRLDLPDTDPNKLTKDKTDPPYTQALMWRANWPSGYVRGAEDYATYQKQPLEDHSWMAGPKTARQLMRELAK